jgi:hypothetical protein
MVDLNEIKLYTKQTNTFSYLFFTDVVEKHPRFGENHSKRGEKHAKKEKRIFSIQTLISS